MLSPPTVCVYIIPAASTASVKSSNREFDYNNANTRVTVIDDV